MTVVLQKNKHFIYTCKVAIRRFFYPYQAALLHKNCAQKHVNDLSRCFKETAQSSLKLNWNLILFLI